MSRPEWQKGTEEDYTELKYSYAIVQLFNQDMLHVLVNMLLKLCQAYEQPAVQSAILAGPQGSFLLSIIQPSLKLIHCLLSHVNSLILLLINLSFIQFLLHRVLKRWKFRHILINSENVDIETPNFDL